MILLLYQVLGENGAHNQGGFSGWTPAEQKLFDVGLKKYNGSKRGKWKVIARTVKTRTGGQCKNYASGLKRTAKKRSGRKIPPSDSTRGVSVVKNNVTFLSFDEYKRAIGARWHLLLLDQGVILV